MNQAIENLPVYDPSVKEARRGHTLKDLTGLKVGWLTVVIRAPNRKKEAMWNCLCKCGNARVVQSMYLREGSAKSCGCANRHVNGNRNPEYASCSAMMRRCYNPKEKRYPDYGGRGITVCDRWRESFFNFRDDMGPRPNGLSLDRRDNEGNYCKENCKWSTAKEQASNRRNNRWIEIGGERHLVGEWAEIKGIGSVTIICRLKAGWSKRDAVTIPAGRPRTLQEIELFA